MIRTQSIAIFPTDQQWYVHREHSFNGQSLVACSYLLVCPRCHEPWAILHFLDDTYTWPASAFCEHCGDRDNWHPVPGSIFVEEGWGVIDDSLLTALPEDLLKREFELHLRAYKEKDRE